MKKVTLSMPIHNVAKFVKSSLLSALNQTYPNIEFLIVDDKGTDNSMAIVRDVLVSHPRQKEVRIIDHGTNRGLGDARNTAIQEATGDYIYFMDSDDVITIDCIEKLMTYMEETPVDFIGGSRRRMTFSGKMIAEDVYQPYTVTDNGPLTVARFRYVQNVKILVEVWNKLYKLDFLRKNRIQCIPGVHVEDVSFTFQTILAARSCRLVPDLTYTYQMHDGQSSAALHNDRNRALYLADCFCKKKEKDFDMVKQYHNREEYGALLSGIYNVTLLHANMVRTSKVLTNRDKRKIFHRLLRYEVSLCTVLSLSTNMFKNELYYFISKFPYMGQNGLLRLIYK